MRGAPRQLSLLVRVEIETRMRGGETFRCFHEVDLLDAPAVVARQEGASDRRRRVRAWVEPLKRARGRR